MTYSKSSKTETEMTYSKSSKTETEMTYSKSSKRELSFGASWDEEKLGCDDMIHSTKRERESGIRDEW